MLALYVISAIVGGGLVLFSALGGLGHGHLDGDHDGSIGHEVNTGGVAGAAQDASDFWLPFTSLRFWTYLLGAFGVTGLVLTMFSGLWEPMVFGLSLGTGALMGLVASGVVRWLSKNETDASVGINDFMGAEARVLVATRADQPGKIRVQIKGDIIDLVAISDTGKDIEAGEDVFVLAFENDRARIARKEDLLN